jgi:hypothetical protein
MKPIKNHEKRKEQEEDLKQKLMLFDRLPSSCLTCHEPFDRMNREQVMSWTVVVRKEENAVHLYCPACIAKAKEIIEDFKNKKIEDFKRAKELK